MTTNNDEIDLIDLIKKVLAFVSKNKWVLIGVFILGSVLGYFQTKNKAGESQDVYRSQFILETSFISPNQVYMIGRELSYDIKNPKVEDVDFYSSVSEIECLKDAVEGKETEINMVFRTLL